MSERVFEGNICHLTFSHSDCIDVWELYFASMSKYFNVEMPHYFGINEKSKGLPPKIRPLLYDDQETYPRRLLSCLEQLTEYEFVFFDHEDMFLYSYADLTILGGYFNRMRSGGLDHIRLIKGGDCRFETYSDDPSLHKLSLKSKWIFSIQPSFWRRETLMKILRANLDINIWDLEVKSQKVVKKIQLAAAFSYRAGRRRGLHHFDNDVYPYIATAIGKGRWNLGEYGDELRPMLERAQIDPSKRGWF
jgi:hypothetical protein